MDSKAIIKIFLPEKNRRIPLASLNEAWVLQNIKRSPSKLYFLFKKITDLFFGLVGFVLFAISFPLIGAIIKLDSEGHVLYKQERVGIGGKKFFLYKYRTMHENGREYLDLWREKDKKNITKAGKVLRRIHIDELPQSINLLRGDLSFIGPRPEWEELANIYEKEIPYYKNRYAVKPGIIGWAQINYPPSRSVSEAKEKFEYDLYYIKNRSLFLDLEIILKSVKLFLF